MTAVLETQDNGQIAWVARCTWGTAEGSPCEYTARAQIKEDAEKMVADHQALRPNGQAEIDARPAREIVQHYPHFASLDTPNVGSSATGGPVLTPTFTEVAEEVEAEVPTLHPAADELAEG